VFGLVNDLLRQSTTDRRIPSVMGVQAPKATLIAVAVLTQKVNELEVKIDDFTENRFNEITKSLKDLLAVQGQNGNWNHDDYMCGMYNGMELMVATIENREPEYRKLKQEDK